MYVYTHTAYVTSILLSLVSSKDLAQNQSCLKKTALRQHATHAYRAQRAAHIVETNLIFLLIEYNLQLGKLL